MTARAGHGHEVAIRRGLRGWSGVSRFTEGCPRRRAAWWLAMVGHVEALESLVSVADLEASRVSRCSGLPARLGKYGAPLERGDGGRFGFESKVSGVRVYSKPPPDYADALSRARGVSPRFVVEVALPTARESWCRLIAKGRPAPGLEGWWLPREPS